jgi:hypothetical protein
MRKLFTPIAFALLVLSAGTAQAHTAPAPAAVATYIPICKNSRGIPDRRACGNKNDPRRSQLASQQRSARITFLDA